MDNLVTPTRGKKIRHRAKDPNRLVNHRKPYIGKDADWRPEVAPGEQLLTNDAVGRWFGVTDKTLRRWVRQHGLPTYRGPSGKVYYARSEIQQWTEQRFMRLDGPLPEAS